MTKQILSSATGTVLGLCILFVGTKVLGPLPLSISQTTTNKLTTFDVSGDGEVTTSPDRAEINLGVQMSESTVAKVQEKGNTTINKITQDLIDLGIEKKDIKTSNYSLYPNYDYRQGQQIIGYNLNVNLQIKVKDFTKITQVVDTATRDGANQIGGVSFTLSDDKQRELETEVRELAITRAKEKAQTLARLSGIRLGKIINVVENGGSGIPLPYPMYAKQVDSAEGMGGGSASPTNVQPGSTTLRMSIVISYETL